ncbi:MAG: STAS domain-containing protein, partial [Burkholderiaceae bacterium]
ENHDNKDTVASGAESDKAYAATQPAPLGESGYAATKLAAVSDISYAATTSLAPMAHEIAPGEQSDFMPTQTISSFAGLGAGFVNSRSAAEEAIAEAPDPELEEAAIRFANGDHAGAESSLMGALRDYGQQPDKADTWTSALFDLYRATGQQARFDNVAIDYAERSGRSAPAWFSIPERLGLSDNRVIARAVPSRLTDDPLWSSPRVLERGSMDELQLAIANAPEPWILDWSPLQQLDANACEALSDLFAQWCGSIVSLRFQGAEALDRTLRAMTPSGAKDGGPAPWRLRMDALRLMGMQDEFELAALDYCVTYEVSPPAWQDVRCTFERDMPEGADSLLRPTPAGSVAKSPWSGEPAGSMRHDAEPAAVVELAGEIVGEAVEALERLESARAGGDRLVVSCANLIRVDFSAAGSILNWVASRQAEGCHLQFRDVHRLVAAFFHIIGINEYARIVLRST